MKNFKSILAGSAMLMALVSSCNSGQQAQPELTASGLNPADFDTCVCVAYNYDTREFYNDTANAQPVKLYTLKNKNGMEVCITNFGGRVVSIMVPDRDGKLTDVCLGFANAADYFPWNHQTDYASSVGRYANRIDGGTFTLPGETEPIVLDKNNNGHASLHGGYTGWQYAVYTVDEATENSITLSLTSPDGDNKFPGNVKVTTKYELTDNNEIVINWDGTTDAPTVLNMTNHTYFNLTGDLNNTVKESMLQVNADNYTPADEWYIPTGEIKPVEGTVFDFRTPKAIGTNFDDNDPEIMAAGGGYDHNWVLNTKGNQDEVCVTLSDARTGIKLDVYTNEPGIQCYTGNFQDGSCVGKGGVVYQKNCAICLESQKFPDSPNKYTLPGWEMSNPFITPEKPYHSYCKYAFSVEK